MDREYLPKEKAVYQAVIDLFEEGADLNSLTVSEITKKAGIGKGTAYEYFSDKEEMIAKAMFYNTEIYCEQLYEGMREKESFYEKMNYLLLMVEKHIVNTNCIVRLMLISDNSILSRRIRTLLKEKKSTGEMPAIIFIKKILEDEFQGEKVLSAEKEEYFILSIFAKILSYMMWLEGSVGKSPEEREAMRSMVCYGICGEIKEVPVPYGTNWQTGKGHGYKHEKISKTST